MGRGEIIAQIGKAEVAQIIVMPTIAPGPIACDIKYRKFLTMHQRADRHGA
jgi:hypothetical protein